MMDIRMQALVLGSLVAAGAAQAQSFSLEGAVIDSRTSQNLGVVTERGDINGVFRAQKAMTFGILRSAGISLEQLPPEVRARIERFQTTNVEAFRAFSEGLDLKDQGKFAEARELFRRAAELDPGFALAAEQQRSMPDINLGGGIQIRTVMLAAAGAAVDRGKASFTVDLSRALAAIQSGQVVIAITSTPTEQAQSANRDFTSNPAGSGAQFAPNQVAGLAYSFAAPPTNAVISLATVNEWRPDQIRTSPGVLESVAEAGGFAASRGGAAVTNQGSEALADSSVFWGSWASAPGANAAVTGSVNGVATVAPLLGAANYMVGEATRTMPTSGTAVFTPGGGMLANASGTIAIDFVNRDVRLQNLGFDLGGFTFSGLSGNATYSNTIRSGAFSGNYLTGSCPACPGLNLGQSTFGGNFVGRSADGMIFSTILFPNAATNETVSGVQLFKRP